MNDNITDMGDVLAGIFKNLSLESSRSAASIINEWKAILCRIRSYSNPNEGQNLADHSRVVDLKNGILLVEVDHPGWIELLQFHKKYILGGLRMKYPQLKINSLAFRLKGKKDGLSDPYRPSDDEIRASLKRRSDLEEKAVSGLNFASESKSADSGKKEFPAELQSLFESLRKNIEDSSEK